MKKLESLFSSSSDFEQLFKPYEESKQIFLLLSPDGYILTLNKAAKRAYGWSDQKIKGKKYNDLCSEFYYPSPLEENDFNSLIFKPIIGFKQELLTFNSHKMLQLNLNSLFYNDGVPFAILIIGIQPFPLRFFLDEV